MITWASSLKSIYYVSITFCLPIVYHLPVSEWFCFSGRTSHTSCRVLSASFPLYLSWIFRWAKDMHFCGQEAQEPMQEASRGAVRSIWGEGLRRGHALHRGQGGTAWSPVGPWQMQLPAPSLKASAINRTSEQEHPVSTKGIFGRSCSVCWYDWKRKA